MTFDDLITKIFSFTRATYYNWLREERLIIIFMNNYFDKDDLTEIIEKNGKLEKLEIIKNYTIEELKEKLNYSPVLINENEINQKLNQFSRGALLYLQNIFLNHQKVTDKNTLYVFLKLKMEPKKFWDSLIVSFQEFKYNPKTENFVRNGFSKKLFNDIKEIFTDEELDYLIQNKLNFKDEIIKILKRKV